MSLWLKSLAFLLLLALPVQARNLAFVVGNDSYTHLTPLQKARDDAQGYAQFFASEGFEVFAHTDLDQRGMVVALATFLDVIRPGDTVVFAFSGHGWSNGSENFLVPTDIRAGGSQTLLEAESFVLKNGLNGVLDLIAQRGPALTVAIIDACRDNPFQSADGTRSIGLARGLVPVQAPVGTFIAFSAGEGQTALDRLSDNDAARYSVFTRSFLEELSKPQDLQAAFKATQLAVNDLARTIGHAQRPAYYDEVIGSACLTGQCEPAAPAAIPPAPAPGPDAASEWQDFRNSNSIAALELFAKRHAGTAYEALALERVAVLKRLQTPKEVQTLNPTPKLDPVATPAVLPSWCPDARSLTEKEICSNALLAAQDIEMAKLYQQMHRSLSSSKAQELKWDQRIWLKERNSCFRDTECLQLSYTLRIDQLKIIPKGSHLVQLGVYSEGADAVQKWEEHRLQYGNLFAGKQRYIQKTLISGNPYYRLQVLGFDGEADSRRFCTRLKNAGARCKVVHQ